MDKYTSSTFGPLEHWTGNYLETLLSLEHLETSGTRAEKWERCMGYLLYREEKSNNKVNEKRDHESESSDTTKINSDSIIIKDENEIIEKDESPNMNWVQCDKCSKWRSVPLSIDIASLPEEWYCELNTWNSSHNSCDAAEEEQNDDASSNEEEEPTQPTYECDEQLKKELLQKFKNSLDALERKKRKREEDRIELEKRKEANRILREEKELQAFVEKLSAEDIEELKRAANKRNWKNQLPIHKYCIDFDDTKATRLLRRDIFLGVDVNAIDNDERTPLHFAYMHDKPNYAKALYAAGAEDSCDIASRIPSEYNYFLFSKKQTKLSSLQKCIDKSI
jgi:hypothetical protein